MGARGAARILRERRDEDTPDEPSITMMDESSRSMADAIIQAVGDRFDRRLTEEISRIDRRLTEEISAVRVEMHEGFGELRAEMHEGIGGLRAEMHEGIGGLRGEMHGGIGGLRGEMHEGFGGLRAEIANAKTDMIRWTFLFWIGQAAAVGGLLNYLK